MLARQIVEFQPFVNCWWTDWKWYTLTLVWQTYAMITIFILYLSDNTNPGQAKSVWWREIRDYHLSTIITALLGLNTSRDSALYLQTPPRHTSATPISWWCSRPEAQQMSKGYINLNEDLPPYLYQGLMFRSIPNVCGQAYAIPCMYV